MLIKKGSLGLAGDDNKTSPVITLTCDFGDKFAVSQMELVAHSIAPQYRFFLMSNEVQKFSILEGAFILQKSHVFAPRGSVHIGVVDPGVGSERRGIVVKSKNYWFVGPDNGLLYPAAKNDGIEKVYEIDTDKLGNITNTFHGRDVFAKVAGLIVSGENLSKLEILTTSKSEMVSLNYHENQVIHIDPYGNIKVNRKVHNEKSILVKKSGQILHLPIVRTFADVSVGEFLAYSGSHDTLEIAVNQGSASESLNVMVGDILDIA